MPENGKKGLITQFKEFISKGNILDLAVGVIIGQSFQRIIAALAGQIITPVIAYLAGSKSVEEIKTVLKPATAAEEEAAIYWGVFLQAVIDFLMIALVLFIIVKAAVTVNKKRMALMEIFIPKEEETVVEETTEPTIEEQNIEVLKEIRDLLRGQGTGVRGQEDEKNGEP